ncbi:MAG: dihydroorotate oxidase [Candidatus Saccharibacteria bacterium]|jgi:dihydroorotate dehydrogenase|nr:dihydroorotate oxidase [Candidatus Saccharibacteria bacterium]
MAHLNTHPIYDPAKTYDDNFDNGPFGAFANPVRFVNDGEPRHSFLGFPIYEPFGIPAGPLLNGRYVSAALTKGFDVVVYKTQRTKRFNVNAFPNVLYVDVPGDLTLEKASQPLHGQTTPPADQANLTITNSFGNPSRGPEFWVPDLKDTLQSEGKGQLIISSVVGTIREDASQADYYADFAHAAELAASTGVKAVEINLSCPNVAGEGILCYTPSAVEDIADRVKRAIGDTPLIVKLGYFSKEQDSLLRAVVSNLAPYAAALSVINTIPAPVVDEHGNQALPGQGRLSSGMCGASIKWAGLDLVNRLSELRNKRGYSYEIIGVGGVMTPDDYQEYRMAGADVVQSATGAMWDPELAAKIKRS